MATQRTVLRFIRASRAAFLHDLLWVPVALFFAYWIRFNLEVIPENYLWGYVWMLAASWPIQTLAFKHFGLYRGIWRFASVPDLIRILKAVAVGAAITVLLVFLLQRLDGVPRSVLLLYPLLLCLGLAAPRLVYRWFSDHKVELSRSEENRALIVGAGGAGELLLRDLIKGRDYFPLGLVDDDLEKLGREIHGVRVLGTNAELPELVRSLSVDIVLLAIPSADHHVVQKIVQSCRDVDVACRTLPSLAELAGGAVEVAKLREVDIGDLLGREAVQLDESGLVGMLHGKKVLVTGAGGSIGSELCRQLVRFQPTTLLLVDHSEHNLYQIDRELQSGSEQQCEVLPILGDIRDQGRMQSLFGEHRPQIVFHAAAYKHVPLVEANVIEGVKTNVLGTKLIADLSRESGVDVFVLVSTDKAVNPTSLMGATKRAAEIYCQALAGRGATTFITTRFGNVLDSAGSVVPLFREQIRMGGPVTVTDSEVSRYFMTIPEACQLILQAGSMGKGGEIFVLEMGEPVKIVNLAEQMIHLSGLEPGKDIEISFIGLRPGEKMHEELFYGSETLFDTEHPKIMLAAAQMVDREAVQEQFSQMIRNCNTKVDQNAIRALKALIPEYAISRDS